MDDKEILDGQLSLLEEKDVIDGSDIDDNDNDDGSTGGGNGESGVFQRPLEQVLHESMIPYTETVVMDRALPRVEDGLKPVQRRILYSMRELDMTPDKPYRKSARLVGDCLGKYHPHGDSSVYDAMCRMSQDFVLRAPLVDGHGNFGSIDGDSPAAMRYTEARMTPLALELLRDLDKDTVRWSLNFDDTLKEPDMLPGRFPNLLVNGASGIAVGVATNIPPHNLCETIDGVVAYIDNNNISLKEMMKIIKAPDFPTGGELIIDEDLENAYRNGKGKIIMRAKIAIETNGDKTSIVITELPYQVNKAVLLQKIAELKENEKEKYASISEIRDESDRSGMRAVIRLKKDANVKKILENLFKSTNLQLSFAINMVAIAGGKPRQLGLIEIISYYTQYQREVIVRRTKYELDTAKERAHIVEGLLIAIKNIDEVIRIIKKSSSVQEAKTQLRSKFNLSERQAQAILDMRLARLVNLEVTKLEEEFKQLQKKIAEFEKILASKKLQYEVVKKEILEIKKNYGTPRKSMILRSKEIKLEKSSTEVEEGKGCVIAISAGNTIKKVGMKNYSMSQKSFSDTSTITDVHTQVLSVLTTDTILIFTNRGNVLKIGADKLKECKLRDKGFSLNSIDKNASIEEKPIKAMLIPAEGEVLFYTQSGMVKKSLVSDILINKSFYQVMKLNDKDEVLNVELAKKDKSILMLTKLGLSLNFTQDDVPTQGRISGGVKGINLDDGDGVVFASQVDFTTVIGVTNNGYVKKLSVAQFPLSSRYRKGLKYFSFAKASNTISYACVGDNTSLAVDFGLKILSLDTKKIVESERLSSGSEIIKKKFLSIQRYEI